MRDVETGADRPDSLRWTKSTAASWSADGKGFYYSRFAEPKTREELKAANYNQKVYYHTAGQAQDRDRLVYERTDHPTWGLHAGETEDGKYLTLFISDGTKAENNFFYRDLSKGPDAPVVELLTNFEFDWSFLGNDGTRFFFLTTYKAPNRRIVVIDLTKPERANWQEIVPEG